MRYALLGALLASAGIAGEVLASRHRPHLGDQSGYFTTTLFGWSNTAYDGVRIAGWTLLVFGLVIVAFALIRESRKTI